MFAANAKQSLAFGEQGRRHETDERDGWYRKRSRKMTVRATMLKTYKYNRIF
jgi:hypothetical protein